jgi:hypothetical protein
VDDLAVDFVDLVKLAELEPARGLDELGLGRLGVRVAKGDDDETWEMDELGVDLEDAGSSV